MDVKDLRSDSGLGTHNSDANIKYPQTGKKSQTERSKAYSTNVELHSSGKVDMQGSRPCAIIGPDRVLPPATSEGYNKSGPDDLWPCSDSYRQFYDHPIKMSDYEPSRNISPRQTFQENMQRIMVPPMYNSNKNSDESSLKNTKLNMPPEAKYCDVPFTLSNEPKTVRNVDVPMSNISSAFTRNIQHNGWQPGVSVRPLRPYPAPEFYQYPEYPSCAGTRPMPVIRPQRGVHEESAQSYSERLYQEANIRFKPYPSAKDRYPQARYEYISNCPTNFHPPAPYQTHKFDIHKSMQGHPYPGYPQVPFKYLERRMPEPIVDGFQRPLNQQANINTFRNNMIPPPYGPIPGNCYQNKAYPYPSESAKSVSINKLPYDTNNKVYLEFDNNRNKVYAAPENFYYNDHSQLVRGDIVLPGHSVMNSRSQHQMYRKDHSLLKNYEYASHYRNIEQSMNVNHTLSRLPLQFSPNSIAISPCDSIASNETAQILGASLEDCGYVSQSSTTSLKSLDSCLANDMYKRYDYTNLGSVHHQTHKSENSKANVNSPDKKGLDVRQFLQMWNEGDEEGSNNTKEVTIQNKSTNYSSKYEQRNNQEQLYVLGLVNVPSEDLCKYDHLQKLSKLPENIKGYNNIELLNQYEQLVESPTMRNYHVKSSTIREVSTKNTSGKLPKEVLARPLSPLDVEAKISQSVIHKEVGCNFEIKPCSPKILNVDAAAPVYDILGERLIEKVTNTCLTGMLNDNKMNSSIQPTCNLSNKQFSIESMKTNNYNLQNLDNNSSVCLASLPQLDNDIDLNFPEVNQQFINANKAEPPLSTPLKDLTHINMDNKIDYHQNHELLAHCVSNIGSEKESTKLSKYRKIKKLDIPSKESELLYNRLSPMQQRIDSVIIENPENIKIHECDHLSPSTRTDTFNHVDTEKPYLFSDSTSNRISSKLIDDPSTETAIDFSLNKHDINISNNDLNIKKSTGFLPPIAESEQSKVKVEKYCNLNTYKENVDESAEDIEPNSKSSRDVDLLNESQKIVVVPDKCEENENGRIKNIANESSETRSVQVKIVNENDRCDRQLSKIDCNNTSLNIPCDTNTMQSDDEYNSLNSKSDVTTGEIEEESSIFSEEDHSFVSEQNQINNKVGHIQSVLCDNTCDAHTKEKSYNAIQGNLNDVICKEREIETNGIKDVNSSKIISEMQITDKLHGIDTETHFGVQNKSINAFDTKTKEKLSNAVNVKTKFTYTNVNTQLEMRATNINQIDLDVISSEDNKVEPTKIPIEKHFGNQSEILNECDNKSEDKSSYKTRDIALRDIQGCTQNSFDIITNYKIVSDVISIKNDEGISNKNDPETCFSVQSQCNTLNVATEEKSLKKGYGMDFKHMTEIINKGTENTTNKKIETNFSEISLVEKKDNKISKINTEGILKTNCDTKIEEKPLSETHDVKVIETKDTTFKQCKKKEESDSDISSQSNLLNKITEISSKINTDLYNEIQSVHVKISDRIPEEKYLNDAHIIEFENEPYEWNQGHEAKKSHDHKIPSTKNIALDTNKLSSQAQQIDSEKIYKDIDKRIELEKKDNIEIDTLKLILAEKNEVCLPSINYSYIDENLKMLSYNINGNINDHTLNVAIKFHDEKNFEAVCRTEPSRLTKQYPSKEYYSPWMQKLYLYTEGLCMSLKDNISVGAENYCSKHIDNIKMRDVGDHLQEIIDSKNSINIEDEQTKNNQQFRVKCPVDELKLGDSIGNVNKKDTLNIYQTSESDKECKESNKDSFLFLNNKFVSPCDSHIVIAEDEQICTNATDATEKCKLSLPFSDHSSKLQRRALKRSLSESALEEYYKNDTAFVKRPRIISTDLCNIIRNHRRNSISEMYNEDNFYILIEDNNYILTDDNETEKICYSEVVTVDSEINNICNEETMQMVSESELKYCQESYESPSLIGTSTINNIEEKTLDETWVEDIACVETIYSDDIAEDIEISSPISPNGSILSNCEHDNLAPLHDEEIIEHMEKVKDIYGRNMCNDDAQIVETLFRTPQMNVKKTLGDNIESHNTEEIETCKVLDTIQDTLTVSNLELPTFLPGNTILTHEETNSKIVEDPENLKLDNILQSDTSFELRSEVDTNIKILNLMQPELDDYAVDSCGSTNDDIKASSENKCLPQYCVSSSPEVTSTTSEEKNSGILLKISSYNGSRISRINEVNAVTKNNRLSYKLTENMHYKTFNSNSSGVLITKAAQKYIPPLKETITDLKVKLTLPQHSLIKLKELKKSKVEPKIDKKLPKQNIIRHGVTKKQKPKFEDVLMNIDKFQYKMHKEKTRKLKEEIPKVVIKKTESGAHYASSSSMNSNDKIYNPDLTGRKWQPWVFLEKNDFIDKMAVRNKQKAVFCHRKNSYVLSEKFRKYKSVYNAKFIISQPISDNLTKGNLKYTIRLKHS